MNCSLEGIIPAIASPCDENDVFLEDTFASLANCLYKEDIRGLYVCGGTGDGYKMRPDERKRAVEIAVAQSHGHNKSVIVHVGSATKDRKSVV